MQSCFLCSKIFDGKTSAKLANHVRKEHNISFEDYVILTQYNNIPPKCACGLCEERPRFARGAYSEYAVGHDEFEIIEGLYIKKYGEPVCLHCGEKVDFYRGEPRRFCSHTCAGIYSGGFNQQETQDKIKEIVLEKYGIYPISKLDSVKEKISQQNTGNSGWNHTPETLEKISENSKLAWKNNDNRRMIFKNIMHFVRKRNWQDPIYRKTILQGNLSGKYSKLHQKNFRISWIKRIGI